MSVDSLAGTFLVATPVIGGDIFWQSVVLLLEHDESGAVGVILNAQTDAAIDEHLPGVGLVASDPANVFIGGPVQPDVAVILVRSFGADFLRPSALGDIGIVDHDDLPDDIVDLRVFAGYAGWDPGQLEAELAQGAWWVVPADRADVFTGDPETMWDRVVAAAPGRIPLHRTYPVDLSTN